MKHCKFGANRRNRTTRDLNWKRFTNGLRQTLALTVIAWSLYGIVYNRLGSYVQCRQHNTTKNVAIAAAAAAVLLLLLLRKHSKHLCCFTSAYATLFSVSFLRFRFRACGCSRLKGCWYVAFCHMHTKHESTIPRDFAQVSISLRCSSILASVCANFVINQTS